MSAKGDSPGGASSIERSGDSILIVRVQVPAGLQYPEYRKFLRRDFFYSCAYCTMTESEAQAIRFTVDHYEPRGARPDLEHEYANLMYACDECNTRKGNRCPPPSARADGYRFFRPDVDRYTDHFEHRGIRVEPKSNTAYFTIESLDLNRQTLRRLRDLRQRLTACDRFVVAGINALRGAHIDGLPQHVKAQAAAAIRNAVTVADTLADGIDALLRDYARSNLIDDDDDDPEEADRSIARAASLKALAALHPGSWRAPQKQQNRPKRVRAR